MHAAQPTSPAPQPGTSAKPNGTKRGTRTAASSAKKARGVRDELKPGDRFSLASVNAINPKKRAPDSPERRDLNQFPDRKATIAEVRAWLKTGRLPKRLYREAI